MWWTPSANGAWELPGHQAACTKGKAMGARQRLGRTSLRRADILLASWAEGAMTLTRAAAHAQGRADALCAVDVLRRYSCGAFGPGK